ncbi:MAG: flagellar hook-associated protein FlgK [Candidatus Gastranaerophilales bacterium]|nr:flagellar hook-associated protein FlgK [Candidatus Gastranaerophilales bacterium]
MVSSLYGFYNSQRALQLNQAALDIINNNIANMNTEGYSKQRLELSQAIYQTGSSDVYGLVQSGGGAVIDDITRNRDTYLDSYYRQENSTLSYYTELYDNISMIEDMTNELSGTGILDALDSFYEAAQELSLDPTNAVTRTAFTQSAEDLCIKFNQTANQLNALRESLVGDYTDSNSIKDSKIYITCEDVNTMLESLANLNESISVSSAQGITPNGLLDKRDLILDQLSEFMPITVVNDGSGMVSVKLDNINLVSGAEQVGFLNVVTGDEDNPAIVQIVDSRNRVLVDDAESKLTSGTLGAILDIGGSDSGNLTVKGMLDNLDSLAREFASAVNTIQRNGQYIDSETKELKLVTTDVSSAVLPDPPPDPMPDEPDDPFDIFVSNSADTQITDYNTLSASNISVSSNISDDPFKIAAANVSTTAPDDLLYGDLETINLPESTGDGSNALALAQLRNTSLGSLSASAEDYLTSTMGDIGVKSESIKDRLETQDSIVNQVIAKRDSTTGVSLDEELVDLVKYQRAYEASAKVFNVISDIMKVIISLGN